MELSLYRACAARRRAFTAAAPFAVACLLGLGVATAQERVTLGLPSPGQSQRVRITQTSHMTMVPPGTPPPGFPAGGIEVETENTMVLRQDVGLPDQSGRTRYDVTYESMSHSVRAQGKVVQVPTVPDTEPTGKTFTVWLDADGQIADVSVPEGLPLTPAQARQMLGPAFAAVPRKAMAIGDVATQPYSIQLPVPGGASAAGIGLSGTTHSTLRAIEGVGTDRVAAFDVASDGVLGATTGAPTSTGAAPDRAPAAGMTMSFKGTGEMRVNLLTGLVISQHAEQIIEGTMRVPGMPDGAGGFAMHGSSRLRLERLQQ